MVKKDAKTNAATTTATETKNEKPVEAKAEKAAPTTTEAAKPAEAAPAETTATATAEKADKAVRARLKEGYERFAQKLSTELKERGKVGKKQWEDAVKATREFVQKSKPELKREDVEKLGDGLRKDVRAALRTIRERGEDFTRSEAFLTARDKGAEFLLKIAHAVKDAAGAVETNLAEALKYRKGDIVGGGTFVCLKCSEPLTIESGPVPACKCGNEELKRKS